MDAGARGDRDLEFPPIRCLGAPKESNVKTTRILLLALLAVFLIACGDYSDDASTETAANENSLAPAVEPKGFDVNVLKANLEAADLYDGQDDNVISECITCGLGMPGSEEHPVETHGYTAHLCSDSCQSYFEENADQVVAETVIPTE